MRADELGPRPPRARRRRRRAPRRAPSPRARCPRARPGGGPASRARAAGPAGPWRCPGRRRGGSGCGPRGRGPAATSESALATSRCTSACGGAGPHEVVVEHGERCRRPRRAGAVRAGWRCGGRSGPGGCRWPAGRAAATGGSGRLSGRTSGHEGLAGTDQEVHGSVRSELRLWCSTLVPARRARATGGRGRSPATATRWPSDRRRRGTACRRGPPRAPPAPGGGAGPP